MKGRDVQLRARTVVDGKHQEDRPDEVESTVSRETVNINTAYLNARLARPVYARAPK